LSGTTLINSKAKARCEIVRVLGGDSLAIFPCGQGETLSLMVTLPNEQCIEIPEAVVRWSRGQAFAVETVKIDPYTHLSLLHYVNKLSAKSDHEFSFEIWR
jgi:hypothetical protein